MLVWSVAGSPPDMAGVRAFARAFSPTHTYAAMVAAGDIPLIRETLTDTFLPLIPLPGGGGTHASVTASACLAIEQAIMQGPIPDAVIIHGSSDIAFAAAVTVRKMAIPVAALSCGVRGKTLHDPLTINRILIDHCVDIAVADTVAERETLTWERVPGEVIVSLGPLQEDAGARKVAAFLARCFSP